MSHLYPLSYSFPSLRPCDPTYTPYLPPTSPSWRNVQDPTPTPFLTPSTLLNSLASGSGTSTDAGGPCPGESLGGGPEIDPETRKLGVTQNQDPFVGDESRGRLPVLLPRDKERKDRNPVTVEGRLWEPRRQVGEPTDQGETEHSSRPGNQ